MSAEAIRFKKVRPATPVTETRLEQTPDKKLRNRDVVFAALAGGATGLAVAAAMVAEARGYSVMHFVHEIGNVIKPSINRLPSPAPVPPTDPFGV